MSLPSKALLFTFLIPMLLPSPTHQTLNPHLLDQLIRDSSIPSIPCHHKTSHPYKIHLPSNLSSISAHISTFRTDSLRRHGAQIEQLTISPGSIFIHPHVKRLLIVHQNLNNLSYVYNTKNISGYQLASPVLGLLFYPSRLHINIEGKPIAINFTGIVTRVLDSNRSMCATFQLDGKVSLSYLLDCYVCNARSQGHYAILVKSSSSSSSRGEVEIDTWKIVVMSCVGGGFAVVMVALVAVAVAKGRREKARVEEMERREYEEEVLRVAMVGHVRAPVAVGARTTPVLESEVYDYDPSLL